MGPSDGERLSEGHPGAVLSICLGHLCLRLRVTPVRIPGVAAWFFSFQRDACRCEWPREGNFICIRPHLTAFPPSGCVPALREPRHMQRGPPPSSVHPVTAAHWAWLPEKPHSTPAPGALQAPENSLCGPRGCRSKISANRDRMCGCPSCPGILRPLTLGAGWQAAPHSSGSPKP